jgi:hypothetical protein
MTGLGPSLRALVSWRENPYWSGFIEYLTSKTLKSKKIVLGGGHWLIAA